MVRIFLAGTSGVIGVRLVPLPLAAGHNVAGMRRSPANDVLLRKLGAEPIVCDVSNVDALRSAVVGFRHCTAFMSTGKAATQRAAG